VSRERVPFNRPVAEGRELEYVAEAIGNAHLSGDGPFTKRVQAWLRATTGAAEALLVHSCTAALELAALLLEVGPGDEVIMPSFTFVSTANAFVLRGAIPVFVDVRPDTLNLDVSTVEPAVGPRTRAVVPVHYAGVPCDMGPLVALAGERQLTLVEDAAQALLSTQGGQRAGSWGSLAALSFHETKNVISGEGGALLLNDPALVRRAEILRDKGTDRKRFLRGEVDKYTWVDIGSSYAPSELNAAFLWAQLERAEELTAARSRVWSLYHEALAPLEARGALRRPIVPPDVVSNAHIYFVLAPDADARDVLLDALRSAGIGAVFHYVPLHSSAAGRRYGRVHGSLAVTDDAAARLVRLPLWPGMTEAHAEAVVDAVYEAVDRVAVGSSAPRRS
jgi:dTDP-4-amino-4,6-dideoxygalactose transaminase